MSWGRDLGWCDAEKPRHPYAGARCTRRPGHDGYHQASDEQGRPIRWFKAGPPDLSTRSAHQLSTMFSSTDSVQVDG